MSKLNTGSRKPKAPVKVRGPMSTEKLPSGKTHEGAAGYARDARTELFMRATTVFAGEGSFYEQGKAADDRAIELIRRLAVEDWDWTSQFLLWLRLGGKIRTSSVMLAAEAAFARLGMTPQQRMDHFLAAVSGTTIRQVIAGVLQRADEPGEMIQYCLRVHGKIPVAVKRGVADAAVRMWNEGAVLRWDKPERSVRFADVIELAHPSPKKEWQSELFRYLLDQRHHEVREITPVLQGIWARKQLSALPPKERHAYAASALESREDEAASRIQRAAVGQWEWVMSWLGEGAKSAKGWSPLTERQRWELILPQMGYMALIRNLRNLDQAGVKDDVATQVAARLADPKGVADSRQLPFRFLSAYLNAPSLRWGQPLETALGYAIPNVPRLDGCTLILVDMSGSMADLMGTDAEKRNKLIREGRTPPRYPARSDAALLFGTALAMKNAGRADMFCFANGNFRVDGIEPGASVLRISERLKNHRMNIGGGTEIEKNLRAVFDSRRHTRVVLLTDEQAFPGQPGYNANWRQWIGDVSSAVPSGIPLYSWNLSGHTFGCFPAGENRYALGGLSDASFTIMQQIENGKSGTWPWETKEVFAPDDDEDE